MNFKEFLSTLAEHRTKDIGSKENFAIALFKSTTKGYNYDPSYAKKLSTPSSDKHLTDDFRKVYKSFPLCHMDHFLKKNLRKTRLLDLLEAFNVDENEKKDFDILTEAITVYFQAFMQIGDNENMPEFNNVYSILVDQHGNGAIPNANENALLAAKEALYSALQNLNSIHNYDTEILKYKGPFENFFADINKVFRTFESKCNREGRLLFNAVKKDALNIDLDYEDNFDINNYLDLISIPGSMPIELQKTIGFLLYDNLNFKDKRSSITINLYDEFTSEMKLDALSNIEFYDVNEIHFSEAICFNIKGSDRNLLEDAFYILYRIEIILDTLEKHFNKTKEIEEINKRFKELMKYVDLREYSFCRDGVFYPKIKKAKYFIPCGIMFTDENGITYEQGDRKMLFKDVWFMNEARMRNVKFSNEKSELYNMVQHYFKLHCEIYKTQMFDAYLSEIITINEDGTARHYLFSVDCKAKYYRTIRKIANRAVKDKTVAFISQSILVANKASHVSREMTSDERIKMGTDILCCYGFNGPEFFAFEATEEQMKNKEYSFRDKPVFRAFIPLMAAITSNIERKDK